MRRRAARAAARSVEGIGALATVAGANPGPFPPFIEPCHPTLRTRAPHGAEWIHEIKIDGYRAQLHIKGGQVIVYSRRGHDWTVAFKTIAQAAESLADRDLVMDGEATVFGATGLPDFQALRRELGKAKSDLLTFQAFDLLYIDGYDLRDVGLIERKRLLKELLPLPQGALHYLEHFEFEDGEQVYRHACKMGLEGIVSKLRDAPYRSGRQEQWVKTKCSKSDRFPIIAFVEKLGARPRRIASLYLGRHEGEQLVYAGKARTGYTLPAARENPGKARSPHHRQAPALACHQEAQGDMGRTHYRGRNRI